MSDIVKLEKLAKSVRRNIIEMTYHAKTGGGHIGGALSSADIFAALYGDVMNVAPDKTLDENRDRFILSKGHVALGYYGVLAECGFISHAEMMTFEDSGSDFPTHTMMNLSKGIETSSGSLGYGLSIGIGTALAAKKKGLNYYVYVLLGDGESNEGSVWEAVMSAAKIGVDNLTAIVDINGQQNDGYTSKVMPIYDIEQVYKGFGWNTVVIDGHNMNEIIEGLRTRADGKPTVVLAKTLKAKGIKSIEGKEGWHHARITEGEYELFLKELEES